MVGELFELELFENQITSIKLNEIGKNTKFFFVQTTFYYYGEFSLLRASSAYNKTTDTKLS